MEKEIVIDDDTSIDENIGLEVKSLLENRSCNLCEEEYMEIDFVELECPNKHKICSSCFIKYMESKIHNGNADNITCVFCNYEISPAIIKKNAPNSQWYDRYLELTLQQALRRDPNIRFCPNIKCTNVYIMENTEAINPNRLLINVKCKECEITHCFYCAQIHPGMTCEQKKKDLNNNGLESWFTDTQVCPGCGARISKISGCDHIICRQCKTGFCFRCADKIEHGQIYPHLLSKHGIAYPNQQRLPLQPAPAYVLGQPAPAYVPGQPAPLPLNPVLEAQALAQRQAQMAQEQALAQRQAQMAYAQMVQAHLQAQAQIQAQMVQIQAQAQAQIQAQAQRQAQMVQAHLQAQAQIQAQMVQIQAQLQIETEKQAEARKQLQIENENENEKQARWHAYWRARRIAKLERQFQPETEVQKDIEEIQEEVQEEVQKDIEIENFGLISSNNEQTVNYQKDIEEKKIKAQRREDARKRSKAKAKIRKEEENEADESDKNKKRVLVISEDNAAIQENKILSDVNEEPKAEHQNIIDEYSNVRNHYIRAEKLS